MVVRYLYWLLILSASLSTFSMPIQGQSLLDEVSIQVEVQDELAVEDKPFYAKLIVHHPDHMPIDESSFQMEGSLLPMQLLTSGKQSSISIVNGKREEKHQTISCYIFEIKGKEKGAHLLPSIEMVIGGKPYHSDPVTYLVNGTETSGHFHLSAFIDAPSPLFPGQSFTVTYRLSMAEPVEVLYENLPLLDLKDCQKMGKRKNRVFYQGNRRVEEFSQTYEVEKAGSLDIETSFLEGRAYSEDFFGRRRYKKEMLRAETKKEKINVQEFPKEGQPSSFNGAIGDFTMNVFLDSGNQVCVGDKLKLKIVFQGKSNLSSIRLPNLSTQEGFKDNFRFNDLPLLAKKEGDKKIFVCELRPMREDITEIPSFEFSYFNPTQKSYLSLESSSLPITILPVRHVQEPLIPISMQTSARQIDEEINSAIESFEVNEEIKPSLIEIQKVYPLDTKNMKVNQNHHYLLYWVLGFVLIIFTQIALKYFFFSKKEKRNSAFYFQEALKNQDQLQNYQLLLEKALLLRLKEQKFIKEVSSIEQLGPQGIVGEVKEFIQDLSLQLFSGQHSFSLEETQSKAKALYKKIGENF